MSLLVSEFRARFPAYADTAAYSDDYLDLKLQEAQRQINEDWFGSLANDAHGYLTAHLLEMNQPQRAAGIQAVSAGPASVTYAAVSSNADDLSSTGYGRRYLSMCRLGGPSMTVV